MFSERFKILRVASGLTQVEFARRLGVTKQCVSNWENNNIQPSIDMLVKISKYFSVSTDHLLCMDDRKIIDVSDLTELQIAHLKQIIRDFADLNRKQNIGAVSK